MKKEYKAPEVEFMDMNEEEILVASGCPTYVYGDGCTGGING